MKALYLAVFVSSISFIVYGLLCLFSSGMKDDFKRFGLEKLRLLTGSLELLGGIGLLLGLIVPPLLPFAAAGLCLLMGVGIAIRIRAKDNWTQWIAAVFFMILNFFICLFATI